MRAQFDPRSIINALHNFLAEQTHFPHRANSYCGVMTLCMHPLPHPDYCGVMILYMHSRSTTTGRSSSNRSLLEGDNDRNRTQITTPSQKNNPPTQTTTPPTSIQMDTYDIHNSNTIHQRLGSTHRLPQTQDLKEKNCPLVTPQGSCELNSTAYPS